MKKQQKSGGKLRFDAPEYIPKFINSNKIFQPEITSQKENTETTKKQKPKINEKKAKSQHSEQKQLSNIKLNIDDNLNNFSQSLITQLFQETYECVICYDIVRREDPIWHCQHCYLIVHLPCIVTWSKKCYIESKNWRCPQCQNTNTDIPEQYLCFCGKVKNPIFQPFDCPHSCGELCMKNKGIGCPHKCSIPCHPGPCPECELIGIERKCHCQKTVYRLKCGQVEKNPRSCGQTCNKILSCKKHFCSQICHKLPCSECPITMKQTCFCGQTTNEKPCNSGELNPETQKLSFQCNKICNKLLSCQHHRCTRECHFGNCGECHRKPTDPQLCACGSTSMNSDYQPRTSCLDPLPTCDAMCGKMLTCHKHFCPSKCHDGPCSLCQENIKLKCRCGDSKVSLPCYITSDNFLKTETKINFSEKQLKDLQIYHSGLCSKICNKRLSCGRHRCKQVCCVETIIQGGHECSLTCGKELMCGIHSCVRACHLGNCPPCTGIIEEGLLCKCGLTKIDGPVPCGTPLPECPYPCSNVRECGHKCIYTCHSGPCPPCIILVSCYCVGNHVKVSNIYCSKKHLATCDNKCEKIQECGVHLCTRYCHIGPCSPENKCKEICNFILPCGHKCSKQCHMGKPCQIFDCKELKTVTCPCGNLKEQRKCSQIPLTINSSSSKSQQLKEVAILSCDQSCQFEERKRNLREAFQLVIEPSSDKNSIAMESLDLHQIPYYSSELIEFAFNDLNKVQKLEKLFATFISDKVTHNFYIPSSNVQYRWLVHNLAGFYGLYTQTLKHSPYDNTILVSTNEASSLPIPTLSEAVQLFQKDPEYYQNYQKLHHPNDSILTLFQISENFTFGELNQLLHKWHGFYRLNWVDNQTVCIIFNNPEICQDCYQHLRGYQFFQLYHGIPSSTDITHPTSSSLTTPNNEKNTSHNSLTHSSKDNHTKKTEKKEMPLSNPFSLLRTDSEESQS